MQVKKLFIVGLSLGLVGTLASCGGLNEEDSKKVIEKAFTMNVVTTSKGSIVTDSIVTDLFSDSNDSLTLTTKQVTKYNNSNYDVTFEYTWEEETGDYKIVKEYTDIEGDTTHKVMSFNYPYQNSDPVEFKFKGTGTVGKYSVSKDFTVKLNPTSIEFDQMSLADLYKKNAAGDNFDFIGSDGKIKKNHNNSFYYITTKGKLVYLAPDGNWGLLSDGEHTAQLYRVDEVPAWQNLVVGKYYEVDAEIASGYGNVQLSFISRMDEVEKGQIADPVSMGALPEGINNKDGANFKPFYCGDSNRECELTNVTLKTKPTSFPKSSRTTFVVTNGSEDITIAWDYHVAGSDDAAAIRDAFTKIIITDGVAGTTKLDIKGSLRWSNTDNKNKLIGPDGAWQVVPCLAGDIAVHA